MVTRYNRYILWSPCKVNYTYFEPSYQWFSSANDRLKMYYKLANEIPGYARLAEIGVNVRIYDGCKIKNRVFKDYVLNVITDDFDFVTTAELILISVPGIISYLNQFSLMMLGDGYISFGIIAIEPNRDIYFSKANTIPLGKIILSFRSHTILNLANSPTK